MARLYFTDPVIALYMNREFNVELDIMDERWGRCAINQEDILINFHDYIGKKIYVAEESEEIFNPKEGDMDQYGRFL
jgi:hypothetical protein